MNDQPKNEVLSRNELLSEQLSKLMKAQNTRMELYKEFDIAFKDYMSGKCPADQYHSICKIVTEGFQDVSSEVQSIEKDMSDEVISGMIRALQTAEKDRLEKTAKLQILMIEAKESDKDYDETIKEQKEKLNEATDKVLEIFDELREELHGVSSLIC
ncbi:DNA repair REX1-B-domain-containing protein [Mycotypha africana]|uniref:DNA repair REX1-B-domain-containing protein n=1 Tax=Mycotypha africana TaxID=64632 RepID=UPI002300728D|nr:DNA repair REX1-B-domain-containing protein [Mycotypha africana]KAI8977199.1 DNA repair REX1-B-domain-containing protein [Mycotypha africana]